MALRMLSGTILRTNSTTFFNKFRRYSVLAFQGLNSSHDPAVQRRKYSTAVKDNKQEVEITFLKKNGEKIKGRGKEGDSILDVVVNNDLDFDGFGACEGTLTCSTCHVILKQADYDRLPEKPSDEEFDMLDLAYGLTDTSRLGCQIQLTKDLNGLEVQLPATVNDARVQ